MFPQLSNKEQEDAKLAHESDIFPVDDISDTSGVANLRSLITALRTSKPIESGDGTPETLPTLGGALEPTQSQTLQTQFVHKDDLLDTQVDPDTVGILQDEVDDNDDILDVPVDKSAIPQPQVYGSKTFRKKIYDSLNDLGISLQSAYQQTQQR